MVGSLISVSRIEIFLFIPTFAVFIARLTTALIQIGRPRGPDWDVLFVSKTWHRRLTLGIFGEPKAKSPVSNFGCRYRATRDGLH